MSVRTSRLLAAVCCAAAIALATGCAHPAPGGSGALGSTTPIAAGSSPDIDPGFVGDTGGPSTDPGTTPTATPATTPATHHPTAAPSTFVTPAYPDDYAAAVLTAWGTGNTAYLTLLTSAAIAHTLRGYGDINTHWTLIRDDGAAGSTYASFYNNGGDEIVLRLYNEEVAAHHWHAASVQSWDVMTFPGTAVAYTKKYVDGWIAGNVARMNLLGTTALTGFYRGMTTPTSAYALGAPFGSGGDVEVEITDAATGLDTSVIIHPGMLGHQHAIGGCDLGC